MGLVFFIAGIQIYHAFSSVLHGLTDRYQAETIDTNIDFTAVIFSP